MKIDRTKNNRKKKIIGKKENQNSLTYCVSCPKYQPASPVKSSSFTQMTITWQLTLSSTIIWKRLEDKLSAWWTVNKEYNNKHLRFHFYASLAGRNKTKSFKQCFYSSKMRFNFHLKSSLNILLNFFFFNSLTRVYIQLA